jgi:hypothetical protein
MSPVDKANNKNDEAIPAMGPLEDRIIGKLALDMEPSLTRLHNRYEGSNNDMQRPSCMVV